MNSVVADTHAIVWYLSDRSKLSPPALAALAAAELTGVIFAATITTVELEYLIEKGKLTPPVLADLWRVIDDPAAPVETLPLTNDVARGLHRVSRRVVPDMPDRIISATALSHSLPLVSADGNIRALNVPGLTVIW
jgi:PIN domain nuclease of toxin-antitoxin system